MKHIRKIFAILMVLGLCTSMAACSSPAADTEDDSEQTETVSEDNKDDEKSEAEAETEENDTVETANIGIIASSMDRAVTNEFVNAVRTAISQQYPDQIGEVIVMDAFGDKAILFDRFHNCRANWDGENNVILLVNDEKNGFSDEDLLTFLQDAEGLEIIVGIDHIIDGAPENTFVYDASDAAGCASLIMENAFK